MLRECEVARLLSMDRSETSSHACICTYVDTHSLNNGIWDCMMRGYTVQNHYEFPDPPNPNSEPQMLGKKLIPIIPLGIP